MKWAFSLSNILYAFDSRLRLRSGCLNIWSNRARIESIEMLALVDAQKNQLDLFITALRASIVKMSKSHFNDNRLRDVPSPMHGDSILLSSNTIKKTWNRNVCLCSMMIRSITKSKWMFEWFKVDRITLWMKPDFLVRNSMALRHWYSISIAKSEIESTTKIRQRQYDNLIVEN